MAKRQYLKLPPPAGQHDPRSVDSDALRSCTYHAGPFETLPAGWRASEFPGKWWCENGYLWGRADGHNPMALIWQTPVRGDHAIRYRAAAIPAPGEPEACTAQNGNLNVLWNSTTPILEDPQWSLCVSGFGGWFSGLSGLEYAAAGRPAPEPLATTDLIEVVPGREYDILGGRIGQTDFLYVDGRLVVSLESRIERHPESYVGISTFGTTAYPKIVRVSEIEVFEIPPEAITSRNAQQLPFGRMRPPAPS